MLEAVIIYSTNSSSKAFGKTCRPFLYPTVNKDSPFSSKASSLLVVYNIVTKFGS